MMRRPVRILILLLTVAVTAGVVWKATVNEQARGRMRGAAQQNDAAAADAIFELVDLRSSLHAYVAPGQGIDFWSKRAEAELDSLGVRLHGLEAAAAAANYPLSNALSSLDGLVATEKRARTAVRNGMPLVAGDIIFTDARDLIDAAVQDLSDARQAFARGDSAREAGMANEQSLLAGGLMAVWIFALIVLVPVPSERPAAVRADVPEPGRIAPPNASSERDDLHLNVPAAPALAPGDRDELRRGKSSVASPERQEVRRDKPGTASGDVVAEARSGEASEVGEPHLPAPDSGEAVSVSALDSAAMAATQPPPSSESARRILDSVAELCTDLARVGSMSDLGPLLGRAASVLEASGLVVWLVSTDGQQLVPAVAHGYDEKQLERMGAIGVDDDNLTAAAFRTSRATHADADAQLPGAVAVPILSAPGTTGVLAAELPAGTDLRQAEALAALIAAQLASLLAIEETEAVPKLEVGSEK